ncbi:MAG: hypothetical protein KJ686_12860, partial [Actinobacteria bacterium]|nr:hypothetical protein [Actinomycetota bacterium]
RMVSTLNFPDHLRGRVEEMFKIDLSNVPAGKEPVFFCKATFEIDDPESAMMEIDELDDVDIAEEGKAYTEYAWSRDYPEGHWNPMSSMPGARQAMGNIRVDLESTLRLETMTKGRMINLIFKMLDVLSQDIRLTELQFENPLDILGGGNQ